MLHVSEIQNAASALGKQYGVENIFLFGSYARGDAGPNSDVDLRIDKGQLRGLFQLAGLKLRLEEALGVKVDLLPSDSLDQAFLGRIQSEEVLLYGSR